MGKYQTKPVIVDAWRWDGMTDRRELPLDCQIRYIGGQPNAPTHPTKLEIYIKEHDAWVAISRGDWIVRDEQLRYHTFSHSEFQERFTVVDEHDPVQPMRLQRGEE